MKILDNNYITPKTTGYAAAVGICASLISGKSRNRALRKMHKPMAYITSGIVLSHVALIEYNKYKWNKKTGK